MEHCISVSGDVNLKVLEAVNTNCQIDAREVVLQDSVALNDGMYPGISLKFDWVALLTLLSDLAGQ